MHNLYINNLAIVAIYFAIIKLKFNQMYRKKSFQNKKEI